ncbi:hypothetical protein [Streptomyces sp. TRM64462]|uniref:hypothetical protein n=1 Tax=Streptomyces sp. TRM64462 TaxID=2741726 RepID=UPI00158641DB|nr:hypothetical protein [Streptomyces sp. TRM64462]
MRRGLRAVAYAVVPGEFVVLGCLVGGVRMAGWLVLAVEVLLLLLLLLLVAEAGTFLWLRRQGLSARDALYELVPEPVVRLMRHELGLMWSLVRWVARRRHGVRDGVEGFGHARDQAALMYGFAFVCVVEAVGVSWLLWDVPVAHEVFLLLDVYTVLFVLGLHAASVTRPHLLDGAARVLRLRQGCHVDVSVPLDAVDDVSYDLVFTHRKTDGELDLVVGGQTSVTLRLAAPVEVVGLLGKRRSVRVVRFHADDARGLLAALKRVRTAPCPAPGTPV